MAMRGRDLVQMTVVMRKERSQYITMDKVDVNMVKKEVGNLFRRTRQSHVIF